MSLQDAARSIAAAIKSIYRPRPKRLAGSLGDGTTAERVRVDDRPLYVYFRPEPYPEELWQVLSERADVPDWHGLRVVVELDDERKEWFITGIDRAAYEAPDETDTLYLRAHGRQHEYGQAVQGDDPAWIHREQLLQLRAATPPDGSLRVYIENGDLPFVDYPTWAGAYGPDLTSYVPGSGSIWVLHYISHLDGTCHITDGASPPTPPVGCVPICYVLLTAGDTAVVRSMIWPAGRLYGQVSDGSGIVLAPTRGDLIAAQGGGPSWAVLSLGSEGQFLRAGANEPAWADVEAGEVVVDAAGFSGNLSPSDTDVQAALETIDAMSVGGDVSGSGTTGRIAEWTDTDEIGDSTLKKTGAGVVEISSANSVVITNPHSSNFDLLAGGGTVGQLAMWSGTRFLEDSYVAKTGAGIITFAAGSNYTITFAKTGTVPVGTGTAGRIAEWVTDVNTLQASTLVKSGAGVLTLSSAGAYTLTVPKTGTVPVGTGTAGRIAEWVTDVNTLQASTLVKSGAGVLTLSAAGAYTLTIPATGTAVLGTGANTRLALWTGTNSLSSDSTLTWSSGVLSIGGKLGGSTARACKVYRTSAQSIAHSSVDTITWQAELFDDDGMWTSGSPTRLTCTHAGVYMIMLNLGFAGSTGGSRRQISIRLNGATLIAQQEVGFVSRYYSYCVTIYKLAVNDYVTAEAFQDSGGALDTYHLLYASESFAMVRIA